MKDSFNRHRDVFACSVAVTIDSDHLALVDGVGEVEIIGQFDEDRDDLGCSGRRQFLAIGGGQSAPGELAVVDCLIKRMEQFGDLVHFQITTAQEIIDLSNGLEGSITRNRSQVRG